MNPCFLKHAQSVYFWRSLQKAKAREFPGCYATHTVRLGPSIPTSKSRPHRNCPLLLIAVLPGPGFNTRRLGSGQDVKSINLTALFWGKGGVPWSRGPGVRTRRLRSILPEYTCKLQALLLHLYRSFPSPLLAPTKESKNIKQLKKGRKCYFKLHALAQH